MYETLELLSSATESDSSVVPRPSPTDGGDEVSARQPREEQQKKKAIKNKPRTEKQNPSSSSTHGDGDGDDDGDLRPRSRRGQRNPRSFRFISPCAAPTRPLLQGQPPPIPISLKNLISIPPKHLSIGRRTEKPNLGVFFCVRIDCLQFPRGCDSKT